MRGIRSRQTQNCKLKLKLKLKLRSQSVGRSGTQADRQRRESRYVWQRACRRRRARPRCAERTSLARCPSSSPPPSSRSLYPYLSISLSLRLLSPFLHFCVYVSVFLCFFLSFSSVPFFYVLRRSVLSGAEQKARKEQPQEPSLSSRWQRPLQQQEQQRP